MSNNQRILTRRQTLITQPGMEGKYIDKDCFKGKRIAVLTSGGDSQGMNSAVRAVVRMGIYCGSVVYFIKEGYQGLVDGGDNIVEATWADVSGIMQRGGTVIGSARCMDFRTHEGRLKGAKNLIDKEITNLVVIGGDGSLTGANQFRSDWKDLLQELCSAGQITEEQIKKFAHLNIVGMVGSIDNDFCGTDMTIGTDTALHRIMEACDAIGSTAHSHQRCFVLEVMGRHCGYLALVAALASEAEWVFIPEFPPEMDWQKKLCNKLDANRKSGQRVNVIIIAEGAIDKENRPITSDEVKNLITKELSIDTRITVLGHVQRGGNPSAFDRILGLRMGAEAVLALMDSDRNNQDGNESEACVISLDGNQAVRVPLMACVEKTRMVGNAMSQQDFELAVSLRGRSFKNNLETYLNLSKLTAPKHSDSMDKIEPGPSVLRHKRIAILNVGAPACGVNAAMRSFTRLMISYGYEIVGVHEGFNGLINNDSMDLDWDTVRGWTGIGGSMLGTRRHLPSEVGLDKVSKRIQEMKLSGVLLLGGFEAFHSLCELWKHREDYPAFQIPMLCIPATISNNIPGTDFTLGADTSLNEITQIIDKIKQSAVGTKRRVFVVETQGAHCGYLATMSGMAGGADAAYIYEESFGIDDLRSDVRHMRAKIEDNVQRGLILITEMASKNYNTDFIYRLFSEEGKGIFDTRINIPGHIQQGGVPSPFDRNMGTKMGAKASRWFIEKMELLSDGSQNNIKLTKEPDTMCLLGLVKRASIFSPVAELVNQADFKNRVPHSQWWLSLRPLLRIMAKHQSLYESDILARAD